MWNHAAVTKVGNFYSLYLNGILDGTATTANAPTFSGSFKIANYYDTGNHGLVGSVDDVQFYSRGCSAVEILQIYNLSQRGYPGVLNRLHWPMNFAAAAAANRLRMSIGLD